MFEIQILRVQCLPYLMPYSAGNSDIYLQFVVLNGHLFAIFVLVVVYDNTFEQELHLHLHDQPITCLYVSHTFCWCSIQHISYRSIGKNCTGSVLKGLMTILCLTAAECMHLWLCPHWLLYVPTNCWYSRQYPPPWPVWKFLCASIFFLWGPTWKIEDRYTFFKKKTFWDKY